MPSHIGLGKSDIAAENELSEHLPVVKDQHRLRAGDRPLGLDLIARRQADPDPANGDTLQQLRQDGPADERPRGEQRRGRGKNTGHY